jgi:hypothetical protein
MIHDGKKWIKKNYNKNFNQQIAMDFWMTKFGPCFQKSHSWFVLLDWYFYPPNMYDNFVSKWTAFYMDFINWLITT